MSFRGASGRVGPTKPNALAMKRAELAGAGVELTDLSDTNPTRHGLFDPAILDVLARHLPRAGRYEPSPGGPWPARASLAERYGGDPDDYWLTASTSEAYGWLFTLLTEPGQQVAIGSPGYPLIEPLARHHGLSTASYRTFYVHPSGWELDSTWLEQTLAEDSVRAVVAVNPNNPTGAYAEPAIQQAAAERGLPLIADEVFFPFRLTQATADSPADPPRLSGNDSAVTFGLDGLSKLLAAPQLKLAWIRLSGPSPVKTELAMALDQIADSYLSVGSVVALALPDLLDLADTIVARLVARLEQNLASAREVFTDLRIRTTYGGWMMLLDVPAIMEAEALSLALMERAGLHVHPGYFYDLADDTLALSLLPEPAVFQEAATRLVAALAVLSADADRLT